MSTESNLAYPIVGLGIAVAGVVLSATLGPPAATAAVAGAVIGNVAAGMIGNIAHEHLKGASQAVFARLREASAQGQLPLNHDLARAIRKSHLNALQFLVEGIREATRDNLFATGIKSFCKEADDWIRLQLKDADSRQFMHGVSLDKAVAEFQALIEKNESVPAAQTLSEIGDHALKSAFAEFSAGVKCAVPKAFLDRFYGRPSEYDGSTFKPVSWVDAAQAFFVERLKTDQRLRAVVFYDMLSRSLSNMAGISGRLVDVLTKIREQDGVLKERFDSLDEAVQTLMDHKVEIDQDSLSDALIGALARPDFGEALARRLGVEAPADSWAAIRAVEDVRSRIATLSTAFFGREAQLKLLDDFVEGHDRGLAVVAAAAGVGKSALLAHWMDRRRAGGDVVVRHFVSKLFTGTTDPIDTLRHLTAQFREFDAIGMDGPAERIPYESAQLLDNLTDRLSRPLPENERLIVILDGLDELKAPLDDVFLRATLAKSIFVVVSGRAAAGDTPSHLKQWETIQLGDVPVRRFDVPGLSIQDVVIWLEESIGHVDGEEMALLAASLRKTTEGLPLFLRFVLEDMTKRLPQARSREERLALVAAMPSSFSKYVGKELFELQEEMGPAWTEPVRTLFALLTRTRGSMADNEIEAFFAFSRKTNSAFPTCPVLTGIDHRVGRWLSMRDDAGKRLFAFAHPRLAIAFADLLGDQTDQLEDDLIGWMDSAWHSHETRRGIRPGGDYALDWLPAHLSDIDKAGKHEAAVLLSSPTFLKERLRDPGRAARRLGETLDDWSRLDQDVKGSIPGSQRWTAFWAQNETALRRATEVSAATGLDTIKPALQCLGDAATSGSDSTPPTPAAMISYPPPERGLLRSIGNAHSGWVRGVLPAGDRLVSWGGEGAILFWSLDGASLAGGAADAHSGGVGGVLPAGDRLVSWGGEGAIRFWSLDGASLAGGAADAGRVVGVLPVGDRLVSWGGEGAILFWSLDGASLAGGAADAHSGGVGGMLPAGDRLVSWGDDGAIRFWSLDGASLAGGAADAHSGGVEGVLPVGDRLVSWGGEGAIRFWSLDGASLAGGAADAHSGRVEGLLPVGDRLVSWGEEGAIRFWSLDGASLAGGAADAHSDWVEGVLPVSDRLVSWGGDGAIRFWSLDGASLAGGVAGACVRGVLPAGDRLVGWGDGGAIRFWSLDGASVASGAADAHSDCVEGVLPVGDRLVSWGGNDAIRFWSLDGATLAGGAADAGRVEGVLPVGDRLVSWGDDGAILFWSLDGASLAGGAADAHSGGVGGMLPAGDRLVSWGDDGAILFWSLDGASLAGGAADAHSGGVEGVLPVGARLVSWGDDGAIRFWSLDGASLAGGAADAHSGRVEGVLPVGDRLVSWGGTAQSVSGPSMVPPWQAEPPTPILSGSRVSGECCRSAPGW